MAPIKKRSALRAKVHARTTHTKPEQSAITKTPASGLNKKQRFRTRHDAFVSRISKTAPGRRDVSQSGVIKRRRPNKKLAGNIGSLLDALPNIDTRHDEEDEWQGFSDEDGDAMADGPRLKTARKQRKQDVMAMKSMKSRPGAMKRREKMEGSERERFARNMAQMVPVQGTQTSGATSDKMTGMAQITPSDLSTAPEDTTAAAQGSEMVMQQSEVAPVLNEAVSGVESAPATDNGASVVDTHPGLVESDPAAQAAGVAPIASVDHSTRWSALRGFISQTMQQSRLFGGGAAEGADTTSQ